MTREQENKFKSFLYDYDGDGEAFLDVVLEGLDDAALDSLVLTSLVEDATKLLGPISREERMDRFRVFLEDYADEYDYLVEMFNEESHKIRGLTVRFFIEEAIDLLNPEED